MPNKSINFFLFLIPNFQTVVYIHSWLDTIADFCFSPSPSHSSCRWWEPRRPWIRAHSPSGISEGFRSDDLLSSQHSVGQPYAGVDLDLSAWSSGPAPEKYHLQEFQQTLFIITEQTGYSENLTKYNCLRTKIHKRRILLITWSHSPLSFHDGALNIPRSQIRCFILERSILPKIYMRYQCKWNTPEEKLTLLFFSQRAYTLFYGFHKF